MNDSKTASIFVTAADQALAEEYATRPTIVDPRILPEQMQADAAHTGETLTLDNGASIRVHSNHSSRQFLQIGSGDPAQAIVDTEIESLTRQGEHLVDQMERMVDKTTGDVRPELVDDYNRRALQLQQLQRAAAYQQNVAIHRIRAQGQSGVAQMQREAAWQDMNRTQNDTAAALEKEFGRVRIV